MADSPAVPWWKYVRALAPAVLFWAVLVGWLSYLLSDRTRSGPENDDANIREWIDETRPFRKTLPEVIREFVRRVDEYDGDPTAFEVQIKFEEIAEQVKVMADPIRQYQGQLPLFPEVYRIELSFPGRDSLMPIVWDSPVPRPQGQTRSRVRGLDYVVATTDGRVAAIVHCEYRLHAFNKMQRDEEQRQGVFWVVVGVVLGGSVLALVWVYLFLRRERRREVEQLEVEKAREHAEVLMLAAKIEAQEAERAAEELNRKFLEKRVEATQAEARAAEAEKSNLEKIGRAHV